MWHENLILLECFWRESGYDVRSCMLPSCSEPCGRYLTAKQRNSKKTKQKKQTNKQTSFFMNASVQLPERFLDITTLSSEF